MSWSFDGRLLLPDEFPLEETEDFEPCPDLFECRPKAEGFSVLRSQPFEPLLLSCATFGKPSHFELTLGTVSGSFCCETPAKPSCLEPFNAVCLFCCSANACNAELDGSFNVRKPSTEPRFFPLFSRGRESREPLLWLCCGRDNDVWEPETERIWFTSSEEFITDSPSAGHLFGCGRTVVRGIGVISSSRLLTCNLGMRVDRMRLGGWVPAVGIL